VPGADQFRRGQALSAASEESSHQASSSNQVGSPASTGLSGDAPGLTLWRGPLTQPAWAPRTGGRAATASARRRRRPLLDPPIEPAGEPQAGEVERAEERDDREQGDRDEEVREDPQRVLLE
jgi:hypothetical protein